METALRSMLTTGGENLFQLLKAKKLKPNKTLDENSSLSYGASSAIMGSQCNLPPDTSERTPPDPQENWVPPCLRRCREAGLRLR